MLDLNSKPLSEFKGLFAGLPAPEPSGLSGKFRAELVGPGWLRRIATPGLALGGLGGWQGKEFFLGEQGLNLVQRGGKVKRIFPFVILYQPSHLDGKPAAAIRYVQPSPVPWLWITDELRWLDEQTLLGLTFLKAMPGLALPFVLHKDL